MTGSMEALWAAGTAVKHIPLTLMVFVLITLAASENKSNPTKLGSRNEGLPAAGRMHRAIVFYSLLCYELPGGFHGQGDA